MGVEQMWIFDEIFLLGRKSYHRYHANAMGFGPIFSIAAGKIVYHSGVPDPEIASEMSQVSRGVKG